MTAKEQSPESEQNITGLTKQIKRAVKGLFYTSESDAPIELFTGDTANAVTQENLLGQIEKTLNIEVETVNFDDFFSRLIVYQEWFGDEEKATADKFATLRDLLQTNLRDLNVFKVGNTEIDIYVVGLDPENKLLGIKTQSVET